MFFLQGRAALKMLFPPCRLNSKSRATLWKQDKKWSLWMTCLQLEVREAGAGGGWVTLVSSMGEP